MQMLLRRWDMPMLWWERFIFCIYFVFSTFSSKYSAHFAFHIRSPFLDCLWINLLRFLHPYVSRVSFLCNIKPLNSTDCPSLFIPFGPWRSDPLGSAASRVVFLRSRRLVGGHSYLSCCKWEWYASAFLVPSKISFHHLNDLVCNFQVSFDLIYDIET